LAFPISNGMKNFFFLVLGLVVIFGSIFLFLNSHREATDGVLKIGETEISVEVADTNAERSLGLSGREALLPNSGMLFYFEGPGNYGFWMKDMKFSIDIIWIDENYRVAGIEKNIKPETYPSVYYPPTPIKYVLEVPAGFADLHQITVGAVVQ